MQDNKIQDVNLHFLTGRGKVRIVSFSDGNNCVCLEMTIHVLQYIYQLFLRTMHYVQIRMNVVGLRTSFMHYLPGLGSSIKA